MGETEKILDVPEGATLGDLFARLTTQHPALGRLRPYTTFARNREVVPADTRLEPGDEVAFLQPVSGGLR